MHAEPFHQEFRADTPQHLSPKHTTVLCACLLAVAGCDGSDFVQVDTEGDRVIFTDPVSLLCLLCGSRGALCVHGD
jgi:hypothetical protein